MKTSLTVPFTLLCLIGSARVAPAQNASAAGRVPWREQVEKLLADRSQENDDAIAKLVVSDPEAAFQFLRDRWQQLPDESARKTLLEDCAEADNPHILDILDLAITDPSTTLQDSGVTALKQFAFRDFSDDREGYTVWRKQFAGRPLEEVVRESAQAFCRKFAAAADAQRETLLPLLAQIDFDAGSASGRMRRQIALEAKLPDLLVPWLSPTGPSERAAAALQFLDSFAPDAGYVRAHVAPLIGPANPMEVREPAVSLVGRIDARWTFDLLLNLLLADAQMTETAGHALFETDDTEMNARRLKAAQAGGLLQTLSGWLDVSNSPGKIAAALQILGYCAPDEAYLRRLVVPLTAKAVAPGMRLEAVALLGKVSDRWATDLLMTMLRDEGATDVRNAIAQALFSGDPAQSAVHRKAALAAGLADILARDLAPDNPPDRLQETLQFLNIFKMDGDFLRRYVVPLTARAVPDTVRYEAISLLGTLPEAWATDRLVELMTATDQDPAVLLIAQALVGNDPGMAAKRSKAAMDAGLRKTLASWLEPASRSTLQLALQLLLILKPESEFLRQTVVPLAAGPAPDNIRFQAILLLGTIRDPWATDLLLRMVLEEGEGVLWPEALPQALFPTNDPALADARRKAAQDAGILDVLARRLAGGNTPDRILRALQIVRFFNPGPDYLQRYVAPLTERAAPEGVRLQAVNLLGSVDALWAVDILLKLLMVPEADPLSDSIAEALFGGSDARVAAGRRKAAVDAGLMEVLSHRLAPDNTVDALDAGLETLSYLAPDPEYVRRRVVPLTAKSLPEEVRVRTVSVLAAAKAPWAFEILLKMLADTPSQVTRQAVVQGLCSVQGPQVIPSLIALLEADDGEKSVEQEVGQALATATGTNFDPEHDAGWWRVWWNKNRARYPEEVRALSIPQLKWATARRSVFTIRRKKSLRQIADDPQRTYWLISPGFLYQREPGAPADPIPVKARPGLLVVLANQGGEGEEEAGFWLDAAQQAFRNGYLVALAIPPKWASNQPTLWVTRHDRDRVKEARFSVESFVAEIVAAVQAEYPIDPDRIFLHGAAESGTAAYACSLDASTPFKGFYLLASPFQSSQLPPLAAARGRRYFLQHSQDDRVSGFWMASAARGLLAQNGAKVKLAIYRGGHGYDAMDDRWARMGEALQWLETTR